MGWIPGFSACSGQHAWHSCRARCIVISQNPQGLATHMVQLSSLRNEVGRLFRGVYGPSLNRLISCDVTATGCSICIRVNKRMIPVLSNETIVKVQFSYFFLVDCGLKLFLYECSNDVLMQSDSSQLQTSNISDFWFFVFGNKD